MITISVQSKKSFHIICMVLYAICIVCKAHAKRFSCCEIVKYVLFFKLTYYAFYFMQGNAKAVPGFGGEQRGGFEDSMSHTNLSGRQ